VHDDEIAVRSALLLLEGDDLLAAVAGTLAVLGPVAGWERPALTSVLAALAEPAPERTTALSATLLELATRGQLAEPAGRLLDLDPAGERDWPAALRRLVAAGVKLQPFPTAVLEACFNATNEVCNEIVAKNAKFKKVWDNWKPYRSEQVLWSRIAEGGFDGFMARMYGAGKV
jgi:hypothetical protein